MFSCIRASQSTVYLHMNLQQKQKAYMYTGIMNEAKIMTAN